MLLTQYLDERGIKYQIREHRSTFTAQEMAAEEHIPGASVAKPVLVKADKKFYMCVLPACCKVDLDALKRQLGAKKVDLADEKELAALFSDCALGAEPPFGNLYNLTTIMDESLQEDKEIVFQAGSHEQAIRMSMADYTAIVQPRILAFSYHVTS